ncbi:acetyl-CoA synthetase-like protein [Phanerochaete sordida]|uniref:Acetyl-CoA synthetase-like protein n=1 Tax=Phanerochaete sordida TaxID=48140 RepID=A0A9P3G6U9_9APHY|nr:acetyl-CoA synthetase-like protein [Phanerochaete sordida]
MPVPLPAFPPLDGSLPVIPGFIDFQAQHNGDRPWVLFPSGSSVDSVSYAEYCDATHRMAWALRPDGTRADGAVVAVIVHCDTVLYLALLSGLVRAGYKPFAMSPKNSVPAFVDMFQRTGCRHIISQPALDPLVADIQRQLASQKVHVNIRPLPALLDIFPSFGSELKNPSAAIPFPPPSKPHAMDDVVVYLHSSGSTGFPKPIPQTQRTMLEWCASPLYIEARKRGSVFGTMPLPSFHTFGFYVQWYLPLMTSSPTALYYPMSPAPPVVPTPSNHLAACRATRTNSLAIVPAFIEAWAQDEESISYLKTLEILIYSGGPLSKAVGDKLVAAGVPLRAVYGATEHGVNTLPFDAASTAPGSDGTSSEAWEWVRFADHVNCRWVPQGDGSYELQYLTSDRHTPAIENLPDARGYATSDLFVPHPRKKGLWRITGRKDDVIVLATGEKVVPIPQECMLVSSPLVTGALMFGHGRHSCGILIEVRVEHALDPEDSTALADFRNKLWPLIEGANALAPTFARIFKEMIIVTRVDKPLPRVAKGTVVRAQALQLYSDEIEKLYNTVADSADTRGIAPPATWEAGDIKLWLASHVALVNNGKTISPSRDMFDQGFDSLHATFLRNRIVGAFRANPDADVQRAASRVSQNFIFEHPTLDALADAVAATVCAEAPAGAADAIAHIQEMLEHYVRQVPTPRWAHPAPAPGVVVLLTGTTGSVGAHALAALLAHPRVTRVYTLNRGVDVRARQEAAFVERGLPVALLAGRKYAPLSGDATAEGMALDGVMLTELRMSLTHVVHNAWRVDFNLALASFEKYVASTLKMVQFCCSCAQPVKLVFTSSISAAFGWDVNKGPVPDRVLDDPTVALALTLGYGASKFVAENIVARATRNGLQATSLRVGQVCGARLTGAWSTSEWVPIIVKSSAALGMFPHLEGTVSWIPVDAVSNALVDLIVSDKVLPEVLNVVHPSSVPWSRVFEHIGTQLGQRNLTVLPLSDWVRAVEEIAAEGRPENLERVPAVKILQFLRKVLHDSSVKPDSSYTEAAGVPEYATANLLAFCPSAASLEPLGEADVRAWMDHWKAQGYLKL